MSGDALEGLLIAVGGLPGQMREGCRKVNGVLTGATGNLQNLPGLREYPAKHTQDGIAIAGDLRLGQCFCRVGGLRHAPKYSAGQRNMPEQ